MEVTKVDYPKLAVRAAESVLLELTRILGEYRDNIVVIGGMVPKYLIQEAEEDHVGTVDIDLALDHRRFDEPGYRTLCEILDRNHYCCNGDQPFRYQRTIVIEGKEIIVQIDLLSGEYGGTGKSHRTQKVQDIRARKARGADMAFEDPVCVEISGELPGGAKDKAIIQIAGIVPFIVMKAMAMSDRLKQKDPYDIHYCLQYFPGGINKIVDAMRVLKGNKLVEEAVGILADKFNSPNHVGPSHIAEFMEFTDLDEVNRVKRDAYERVQYLLANYTS